MQSGGKERYLHFLQDAHERDWNYAIHTYYGLPDVQALPHYQAGYFDLTTDEASNVRKEMVEALEELGIVVEASHHEVAIGQHEIDFKYDDAMQTRDTLLDFMGREPLADSDTASQRVLIT